MRTILVIALLLSSNIAIAKKKVEHKEPSYRSIFDADLNNLKVEICCFPKKDPKNPTHWYNGMWF